MKAGVNLILNPCARFFQEAFQHLDGFGMAPVVVKFPGIVELMPGLQRFPFFQHGLIDPEVTVFVPCSLFFMPDFNI